MTFIEQIAPYIRQKLQGLVRVLGMTPSQLVDIAFKVYNGQETRKLKQATVFLAIVEGEFRPRWRCRSHCASSHNQKKDNNSKTKSNQN